MREPEFDLEAEHEALSTAIDTLHDQWGTADMAHAALA